MRGGGTAGEVAGHTAPTDREMDATVQLPRFSIFRCYGTPVDEMGPPHSGWVTFPQVYLSANEPSVTPRGGPSR